VNTVTYLMTTVAAAYEFVGRVLLIAIGWTILWGSVQLLLLLAWSA
jgi:hypothetical protein